MALILVAASLAMAGCSDSEDEPALAPPAGGEHQGGHPHAPPVKVEGRVNDHGREDLTSKGSTPTLAVVAQDFHFGPTYVKVQPGSTLKVTLRNEGKAAHTFTAGAAQVDVALQSGATQQVDVVLPANQALVFRCRFHADQGMQGAIYSKEGVEVPSLDIPTTTVQQ